MKSVAYISLLLPLLIVASAHADEKPTLQTIVDAWKECTKKIESLDISWWAKHVQAGREPRQIGKTVLSKMPEAALIQQYRFVTNEKNQGRFEVKRHVWSASKQAFIPSLVVELFSGNNAEVSQRKDEDKTYSSVRLKSSISLDILYSLQPIIIANRPLDKAAGGFDESKLVLTDRTETIDNCPTWIVTDGTKTAWVDPSKDFAVVKFVGPIWQFSTSYCHDESNGWVPESWNIDAQDGKYKDSAKVTKMAINKRAADSEFVPDYSGGAIVNDLASHASWLIYPDGKKRELMPGEYNGNNEKELLDAEPGGK